MPGRTLPRFGATRPRGYDEAEEVVAMNAKRRWSELSEGQRRVIMITGVLEGILKIAALIDLRRRPASQVRGPKWLWASTMGVVSSAGVLPIAYFLLGRRRRPALEAA
jgi:hypothetical protein